ncbi:multiple epidermal growth factor-like domains protein 10 [Pomacea canaliculata]|uniref:multiple epidermal growth factor-like domains protein 10 n=1 Tax=Pomacea canaliculata TaxID=400727 RepID=UPI000D735C4D|nr:multiple epidermal growth factor-like domains protein 10 [Pomacea canaliculata]
MTSLLMSKTKMFLSSTLIVLIGGSWNTIRVCSAGRYGQTCDELCNGNCKNNETCDNYSGKCWSGCKDGLYGDICNQTCGHCRNIACEQTSGKCLSGCLEGWKGTLCNTCTFKSIWWY